MIPLRSAPTRLQSPSDGFIVVAVLWIIIALASLTMIYATYVSRVASSISVDDDRLQSEALMSAALELTAYQLTTAQGDTVPTHGQLDFHTDRARVLVQYRSEAARVDLNRAPKELLAGLFAVLGTDPEQAKSHADSIIAWRTPRRPLVTDEEASRYLAAGLSYVPRSGPFAHVEELRLVRGLRPELIERAMPFLTVYSGLAGVDVREAAPEVIAALPGMTQGRLNAILQQRQAGSPQGRPASSPDPTRAGGPAEPSKAVRVDIHIAFENGRRIQSEAVIVVSSDTDAPYHVLSWHDGFDDPIGIAR